MNFETIEDRSTAWLAPLKLLKVGLKDVDAESYFRRMSTAGITGQPGVAVDRTEQLNIADALVRILVPSRATAGLYTICEAELAVDRAVPRHSHSYEDLFLYVVQGEFEVELAQQGSVRASSGASLFIPRQTFYSLRVLSSEPGRVVIFAQPGGLDLLFRDALAAGQASGRSLLLEKHGIHIPPSAG